MENLHLFKVWKAEEIYPNSSSGKAGRFPERTPAGNTELHKRRSGSDSLAGELRAVLLSL
jgi:hypothetical protein